jgi:transcriptional accessory protein Tex/SPT6
MAVEVGQIVPGTVVRLLQYGVLVRLDDGTTGLVHISEIDQNYVRDVGDYFQVNDPVSVKVLATGDRGKVELSVKQALGEGLSLLLFCFCLSQRCRVNSWCCSRQQWQITSSEPHIGNAHMQLFTFYVL